MDLDFNLRHLAVVLAVPILFLYTLQRISLHRRRQTLKQLHGAKEGPWLPAQSLLNRYIGLDLFVSNTYALATHTFLPTSAARSYASGYNTYQQTMAGQRVYLTIEPENIKAILATQFKVWKITPRGTRGKSGYPGPGIVTTNGAAWAHSRELLRPNFVRAQVCDLAMTFRPHVSAFIAALPKDGSTVDLGPIFHRLTMDTAIDLLFGVSTDWLTSGDDGGFAEAVKTVNDNFTRAEQLGGLAQYIPTGKKAKKAIKYIQCVVDAQVDRALANKSTMSKRSDDDTGRYIFLDELARRTEDRFRIRSELFNVLIAGRDATACLLTNLWFILSTRPDIWATLQSEVATLDGIEPSIEQIKHLAYVRAVVNESLRMHPVASFNMREALEDTVLPVGGGSDGKSPLFVPKGKRVMWNVYALHHRKDLYGEDADDFKPERWLDDSMTGKKGLRPGWEFLPFSGGPRVCIGQQFAVTEASYTTIRLCQAFAGIQCRGPSMHWEGRIAPLAINKDGAQVSLLPRGD